MKHTNSSNSNFTFTTQIYQTETASLIFRELKLRYPLIAVIPSDNKPEKQQILKRTAGHA
ncbi:MAG: hypothetical protein JXA01_11145 [Dehalococcoidia bacterium]|nr:hypothetical protein [Dehalococcoidia bacterium]